MSVVYRFIADWPNHRIGDDGSVWKWRRGEWVRLKHHTASKIGYLQVTLCDQSCRKRFTIHTLVLMAFVGPRPPGLVCRHLDGNPTNNRPENLAWGTYGENMKDCYRHGMDRHGERNSCAKLTDEAVLDIRQRRLAGEKLTVLAAKYKVCFQTISDIALGKVWRHLLERPEYKPKGEPADAKKEA